MHSILFEGAGLVTILAAILFMRCRLPDVRRLRARKQALAGTGILMVVLGLSYAQMAPVHGWPARHYWSVGLYQEPDNSRPYCAMIASTTDATMSFALVEGSIGTAAVFFATQPTRIIAPEMRFSSDGFDVLTSPAKSDFTRNLRGQMNNMAAAKLDTGQWERLWQTFLYSGTVAVATAFGSFTAPTEGFAEATSDFGYCLGQLDLIAPPPHAPPAKEGAAPSGYGVDE
jgi:hypothetical protein